MPKKFLTDKYQKFVEEYLKDANGARAARAAGYAEKNSRSQAMILLRKPKIIEALDEARKIVAKRVGYNLEKAMQEAQDAIEFAKKSPQGANAYVKAVELRAKLNGLLVEKFDVRQSGFSVVIKTISPQSKALPLPVTDLPLLTLGQEE